MQWDRGLCYDGYTKCLEDSEVGEMLESYHMDCFRRALARS